MGSESRYLGGSRPGEEATLLKTETEVLYPDPAGKITDLLVEIDEQGVGVSVTDGDDAPLY